MSGVAIIRELLATWTPLTALVPAARVYAGQAPQGAVMPAVSVSEVGVRERPTVARRTQGKTSTARVQVTVLTKDYPSMKAAIKAAALGPGVHTGTVKGYSVKSVEQDGIGPEIPPAEDGIFEQSRDFLVTFSEPN